MNITSHHAFQVCLQLHSCRCSRSGSSNGGSTSRDARPINGRTKLDDSVATGRYVSFKTLTQNEIVLIVAFFSAADRYALLPKHEDFVFDFSKNPSLPLADGKSFPALVGTGLSFSLSQLPGMIVIACPGFI